MYIASIVCTVGGCAAIPLLPVEMTKQTTLHQKTGMNTMNRKNAICNICTIRLVEMVYQRAPWFRLVREPLKYSMRLMAVVYRVNPGEYDVRTPSCYGCMRFYKLALKEKSGLFRFLNALVNPHFDALMERILTSEEVHLAETYARAAMLGEQVEQSQLEKEMNK